MVSYSTYLYVLHNIFYTQQYILISPDKISIHFLTCWSLGPKYTGGPKIEPIQSGQVPMSSSAFQFSSVTQYCPILLEPNNCSTPGLPVHHQLLESTQTHFHCVSDAIQPSHPLSSPSHPTFNLSQHQGLFQWVSSSHQVAKVLEFQLQHQSFQWVFRTDFL